MKRGDIGERPTSGEVIARVEELLAPSLTREESRSEST
jgi:hypothetical protein